MLLIIIIILSDYFAMINPNVKGVDVEVLCKEEEKKKRKIRKRKVREILLYL
jgi:hypothetical protein